MAQFFIGQQQHLFNSTINQTSKNLVNDTNNHYEIVSIFVDYTSSSLMQDRVLRITKNIGTIVMTRYLATTVQGPSITVFYDFGLSSPAVAAVTPTGSTNYSRQNLKPIILAPGELLQVTSLDSATGQPVAPTGEDMRVTFEWLINKVGVVA